MIFAGHGTNMLAKVEFIFRTRFRQAERTGQKANDTATTVLVRYGGTA
jgi:hypothetical protein